MIDIETIGTGGGSIAWITREGHLKVGPKSAGAEPGPMCYPKGGSEPTITDANLVLGRIPAMLIGGEITLNVERPAPASLRLPHDCRENMSAEQLAHGIIEIANWNQANAIRQMTIQRGIDPRGFALLSFGGAGPAQSPAVMDLLNMQACIVPPNPGNLSAFGLLAVDWRTDQIVTKVMHQDNVDLGVVADSTPNSRRGGRDANARRDRALTDAAGSRGGCSLRRPVDGGPCASPGGLVDADFLHKLVEAFNTAHKRTFGYNYAGQQKIEVVNFCVSGFGLIERPELPKLAKRDGATPARKMFARSISTAHSGTPRSMTAPTASRIPARRASHRRGVRLHHRCIPRTICRGRSTRRADRPLQPPTRGGAMTPPQSAQQHRWPVAPQRAPNRLIRSCFRSSRARSIPSKPRSSTPSSAPPGPR